jgi:hypothetical protein
MEEELVDAVEATAVAISIIFVVWMAVRGCEIRNLSYSTEIPTYSTFLKVNLVFSLLIPLAQLGIGLIAIVAETPADPTPDYIPAILVWDYILLIEYFVVLVTGWILSCFIMVMKYRTLHESREKSLICFWGYYCVLHFTCGILRAISISGDETTLKLVGVALHFFAAVACAMLELIFICTKDTVPTTELKDFKVSFGGGIIENMDISKLT